MFDDNDLEQTKSYLRSKLPDYLRTKGINPDAKFKCLNPKDLDNLASMSYLPSSQTVRCFNCNRSYDIFDLVGIDYHLNDFRSQFIKAHQMFIGSVPNSLLMSLNSSDEINYRYPPTFEIAPADFEIQNTVENNNVLTPTKIHFENKLPVFRNTPGLTVNQDSKFKELTTGQNVIFGSGRFDYEQNENSIKRFSDANNLRFSPVIEDNHSDFSEYIAKCASNCLNTKYFKERGLTAEIVRRFNLGYDSNTLIGLDQTGQQIFGDAIIIPYGIDGFKARFVTPVNGNRFRCKGYISIFNEKALENPGKIFITEGEFDALTLECLGYNAIALGGVGNVTRLSDLINKCKVEHIYYICLDNDEAGEQSTKVLTSLLYKMKKPYKVVNISFPYKDPNEAWCAEPEIFKERLNKLDLLLNREVLFNLKAKPDATYITSPDDLSSLRLNPALYSFCGRPVTLRLLVANIINAELTSLLYAATPAQYQSLRPLLSSNFGKDNIETLKSQFLPLTSSNTADDIKDKLSTCILQGVYPKLIVVDASHHENRDILNTAIELNNLALSLNIPVIILGSQNSSEILESITQQNIEFNLTPDGDIKCETVNIFGKKLSFIKYTRI